MWMIKSLAVLNLHPMLIAIAEDVKDEFGIDIITSAHRPGDSGVHGHFRGLDLRCRNPLLGHGVEGFINTRYLYDPTRPEKVCALWHKVEGGEFHLHLQVHPNTKKRRDL